MDNQKDESSGRVNIIRVVQTPLGFFTLVVLIAEGILGGLAIRATGADFTLLVGGMLLVLVSLIVVVAMKVQEPPPPPPPPPPKEDFKPGQTPFEHQLQQIGQNIQHAMGLNIQILTEEISEEINTLAIQSEEWSRGELQSSVERYNKVLIDLYLQAENSIFSTTIRDYLIGWPEDLLETMIDASEKSRATSVTRVFIFTNREEIDERAIAILRRFKKSSKIKSLVYIGSEARLFNFPPEISRDFVVIDGGKVIGITVSYGPGSLQARWFFRDERRMQQYQTVCNNLARSSIDIDRILVS